MASSEPSPFQSSVVTSLAFSFLLLECFSTTTGCAAPSGRGPRSQMRAVESPDLPWTLRRGFHRVHKGCGAPSGRGPRSQMGALESPDLPLNPEGGFLGVLKSCTPPAQGEVIIYYLNVNP